MRVALTVWQGRISPLFDATRMLLIAQVDKGKIAARHYEPIECDSAVRRAAKLDDLEVNILICGGISDEFAKPIEAQGIRIVPFVSGSVEEGLHTHVTGLI